MSPYILPFEQVQPTGRARAGGKGYTLGRLQQAGFPVPSGFVVTMDAYHAANVTATGTARPAVENAVRSAYVALGAGAVAVRSSALAEDGAKASFAGQHESYLNVVGAEAVWEAVRACWASLENARATAYRAAAAKPPSQAAMAVVVQKMAPTARSGVAFTLDPVTGRRDVITIEAVAGVGDALMGGQVVPHRYAVPREGAMPPGDDLLDAERLARIARLAEEVAAWAGCPQDVEWSMDAEGQIYVLQARPITAPTPTSAPIRWTRDNVGEVVPGPVTPLSWSILDPLGNHAFAGVLHHLGVRDYPAAGLFGRFYGRVYFNQTLFQALMNRFYPSRAGWRATPRLLWTALRAGLLVLTLPAKSRRVITAILTQAHGDGQSPSEIAVWRRLGYAAMEIHLAVTALAELLYQALDKLLLHWGDGATTAAVLTAGLTGMRSAEAGKALADLGRLAAQDPELRKLIQTTPPERLLAGLDATEARRTFAAHLTAFLDQYGHGAAEEFELAAPRWRDDPVIVLRALRSQVLSETADTDHKVDPTANRRAATARVEGRLGLLRRFLFRYLLHQTQAFITTRENLKYHFVIAHSYLRDCYLAQARLLVAAGQLPDVGDIFFLTADEVTALTKEQLTGAEGRSLVAERRRQWDMDRRVTPPPALDQGADGRYWPVVAVKAESAAGGVALRGFAAGPGTYTGRARIIRTPDEGARLQPGEVLVAPAASPGWTPLFLTAGALITEIGGALSHAAIIAREYGLPAVLNVTDALNRIHTGQLVHVDGTGGIVNLIEELDIGEFGS